LVRQWQSNMADRDRRKYRIIRHRRIRKKIKGDENRPRLCVFRSSKHIYAQIIDDRNNKVLAAASTDSKDFRSRSPKTSNQEAAFILGKIIAARAKEKGIEKVSFDRGGYAYWGRVRQLAEGAREGGLTF